MAVSPALLSLCPQAGASGHAGTARQHLALQLRPQLPARWLHFNDTGWQCRVNEEHGEIFYSSSTECLLLIFE